MDDIDIISQLIKHYLIEGGDVLYWGTKENCDYLHDTLSVLALEIRQDRLDFHKGGRLTLDYSPQNHRTSNWNYAGCHYSLIVFEDNLEDYFGPCNLDNVEIWGQAQGESKECEEYMRSRNRSNIRFKSMFVTI